MRALRSILALVLLLSFGSAATYQLRFGDTLGAVARRFGVSVGALASANGISNPNRVQAGHVLTIPGAGGGSGSVAGGVHVVRSGETLGGIAKKYRTSVSALAKANGISNPNRLQVGQRLKVVVGGGFAGVCPVHGGARFIPDFGAPRGGGRRHEGVDLLAPKGTPVVANVSGVVQFRINPRGGLSYYLHGTNGVVYYGAHLATFVGHTRHVRVGETIGTVGNSGNAAGGATHLHFEKKPAGGKPVDPYGPLLRVCPRR